MEMRSYKVIIEEDKEYGYVAKVPELPGCYGVGKTKKAALADARHGIHDTLKLLAQMEA